jgi:exosortase/archaeosortase family protein
MNRRENPGFGDRAPRAGFPRGLRSALVFGLVSTVLFALYTFPYAERGRSDAWLASTMNLYARVVGGALGLIDPSIFVSHNQILGRASLSITPRCDAMDANILFCAALLAVPVSWWRTAGVLAAGLSVLVAFNVLRLCCDYYVGVHFPAEFELVHFDLAPMVVMAFAFADFLVCAERLQGLDALGRGPWQGPIRLPVGWPSLFEGVVFVGVLAALLLPWPWLGKAYAGAYSLWANLLAKPIFATRGIVLSFAPAVESNAAHPWAIVASVLDPTTRSPLHGVAIDLRRDGYLQMACYLASALAFPMRGWVRSKVALAVGLCLFATFGWWPIVLYIAKLTASPTVVDVLTMAYRSLVTAPGMALAVPALLWQAERKVLGSRPALEGG